MKPEGDRLLSGKGVKRKYLWNVLTLSLLVVTIISLVLGFSFHGQKRFKSHARKEFQDMLHSFRDSTTKQLNSWSKNAGNNAQVWANRPIVRAAAMKLLGEDWGPDNLASSPIQKELREYIDPMLSQMGHLGYFIISPEGINLGSTRDRNLGRKNLLPRELLDRTLNGWVGVSVPQQSDVPLPDADGNLVEGLPTMFSVAPIRNASDKIIAIFALRLHPQRDLHSVFREIRPGKSGETYAFNRAGLMLNESRFMEQLWDVGVLEQGQNCALKLRIVDPGVNLLEVPRDPSLISPELPFTKSVGSAIRGESDMDMEGYHDYRGVTVIGAWAWVDALDLGFVTEIDQSEAYAGVLLSNKLTLFLTLASIVALLILVIAFAMMQYRLSRHEVYLENEVEERTHELQTALDELRQAHADAEELLTQFQRLVDNVPGVVYRCANDVHWSMTLISEDIATLTSYPASDFIGNQVRSYASIIHPEDMPHVNESVQTSIKQRKPYAMRYRILARNGDCRWVYERGTPIFDKEDGQLISRDGVIIDFSERKAAEEALEQAKLEADAANRAKTDFLSSMSHELRTPMNAVLGFTQLLEMDSDDSQVLKTATEIRSAGEHLLNLINEVLHLAKIEAGKITLSMEPVTLNKALTECVKLTIPLAENRGIKLYDEITETSNYNINADYTRFKEVMLNLLSNAVKYNKENGSVFISCQPVGENLLRFSVRDTGQGIPPEKQKELFKPFNRLDKEASDVEGTGIGLVITKNLVELMGGTMGVDSEPGQGCTFWVELERAVAFEEKLRQIVVETPERRNRESAEAPQTILYIEDNRANLLLMKRIVEKKTPHEFISAADGLEGLDLAMASLPDLILLDITLPTMDGFEVFRELRSHDATKSIPVLAVSANAMDSDIQKYKEAGFTDYVTKPIDVRVLLEKVGEYMSPKLGGAAENPLVEC